MEVVYETEKKSFRIKALKHENNVKEVELEKKKNTVYFLIVIVALFAGAGLMITRAYQQKNKANKIIYLQKKASLSSIPTNWHVMSFNQAKPR